MSNGRGCTGDQQSVPSSLEQQQPERIPVADLINDFPTLFDSENAGESPAVEFSDEGGDSTLPATTYSHYTAVLEAVKKNEDFLLWRNKGYTSLTRVRRNPTGGDYFRVRDGRIETSLLSYEIRATKCEGDEAFTVEIYDTETPGSVYLCYETFPKAKVIIGNGPMTIHYDANQVSGKFERPTVELLERAFPELPLNVTIMGFSPPLSVVSIVNEQRRVMTFDHILETLDDQGDGLVRYVVSVNILGDAPKKSNFQLTVPMDLSLGNVDFKRLIDAVSSFNPDEPEKNGLEEIDEFVRTVKGIMALMSYGLEQEDLDVSALFAQKR